MHSCVPSAPIVTPVVFGGKATVWHFRHCIEEGVTSPVAETVALTLSICALIYVRIVFRLLTTEKTSADSLWTAVSRRVQTYQFVFYNNKFSVKSFEKLFSFVLISLVGFFGCRLRLSNIRYHVCYWSQSVRWFRCLSIGHYFCSRQGNWSIKAILRRWALKSNGHMKGCRQGIQCNNYNDRALHKISLEWLNDS